MSVPRALTHAYETISGGNWLCDQDAVEAFVITDELRMQPGYDTLVICTLSPGISRWLKLDLVHRAERKFGLRIIHVVAAASAPARS